MTNSFNTSLFDVYTHIEWSASMMSWLGIPSHDIIESLFFLAIPHAQQHLLVRLKFLSTWRLSF